MTPRARCRAAGRRWPPRAARPSRSRFPPSTDLRRGGDSDAHQRAEPAGSGLVPSVTAIPRSFASDRRSRCSPVLERHGQHSLHRGRCHRPELLLRDLARYSRLIRWRAGGQLDQEPAMRSASAAWGPRRPWLPGRRRAFTAFRTARLAGNRGAVPRSRPTRWSAPPPSRRPVRRHDHLVELEQGLPGAAAPSRRRRGGARDVPRWIASASAASSISRPGRNSRSEPPASSA